jgi:glycosyltransferase involved in cell wall biosynthesis
MSSIILIPAYKADHLLVQLVERITTSSQLQVVIVNDGSPAEFDSAYIAAAQFPRVTVLTHPVNLGKGAALKTGFRYIINLPPEITCVVTADADGQHTIPDILAVAEAAEKMPGAMIIGGRRFDKDVPPRSMFGNTLTRWVLRIFFGINLYDTQTGLRGIPRSLLPELIDCPYDRYDLELEMLLIARRKRIRLVEIPIQTIYIEKNRSSHFKPVRDSIQVYFVLLRGWISASIALVMDYLVFFLSLVSGSSIPLAMFLARLVSIPVYFYLLNKWDYIAPQTIRKRLAGTASLAFFLVIITSLLIPLFTSSFSILPIVAKFYIEAGLFLFLILLRNMMDLVTYKEA